MSISTTIKTIQDIMRKDAGVDGDAQRISQLVWMFFLKIYDDREKEYELMEDDYVSPIPDRLRWCNWAADPEGITGDELLDFVNNDLFKTLKDLSLDVEGDRRGFVVRSVFEDAYNYMKSGTLMRQVVNKLNEINFNKTDDLFLFGDIYEQILKDLQSAGNAGEFYTPRAVTKFMVDRVDPKLGENMLDPACGTGGFLTATIEHVRGNYVKSVEDEAILQNSISGVEKKPLPHLLCVTNMLLHNVKDPSQIRHDNTLARPLRDYGQKDKLDVIVTNPPFGGMEEDGIESNFPATFRTRETADLFLVLIMHLLKDNGRGAIVLPDGTLFGEGVKTRIKEELLEKCNLHTIVRLPNGVFNPYTGIKTNLLFFTKGEPTKEVWFYEHTYPEGYKSYSKTKPLRIEEFEPEKSWWDNREENEFAWRVPIEEIKSNGYNLDIKNPNVEDECHGDPDELLQDYHQLLHDIADTRNKLRDELVDALGETKSMNPETFFDNFGILVDVPDGVSKLRGLILQLAVQGKLVPQDQNDEPASVLLGKIKAEKERLVKEKKIKTFKKLPDFEEDELPYELPNEWLWTQLDQIANSVHYGYTASANHELKDIRLLRITDIQNGRVNWDNVPGCEIDEKNVENYKLYEGDLLIARTGGTIGKSYLVEKPTLCAIFASYIIRVIPNSQLFPNYLKIFLESPLYWKQLYEKSMGTGQPNVNGTSLRSLILPLPPLEEQRRIVAKVDQLMVLCDELESKLDQSQTDGVKLMEAVVAELVGA